MQIKLSPTKAKNSPIKSGAKGAGGNAVGTGWIGIQSIILQPDGQTFRFTFDRLVIVQGNGEIAVTVDGSLWGNLSQVIVIDPGTPSIFQDFGFTGSLPIEAGQRVLFSLMNQEPETNAGIWNYNDTGDVVPDVTNAEVQNTVI